MFKSHMKRTFEQMGQYHLKIPAMSYHYKGFCEGNGSNSTAGIFWRIDMSACFLKQNLKNNNCIRKENKIPSYSTVLTGALCLKAVCARYLPAAAFKYSVYVYVALEARLSFLKLHHLSKRKKVNPNPFRHSEARRYS